MRIRAVVFDFDGVLANSEPLHLAAFQHALATEGITITEPEYYDHYLGFDDIGSFEAAASLHGRSWNAGDIARLMACKAVRLEDLERDRSILFPGAADAVNRLARDYTLAIASGALKREILRVLDREQLTRFFRAVVSAEDTPASKPAPDPYVRSVELLRQAIGSPLRTDECVAIEDSRWGIESARAAGLLTVAITTSYTAEALGAADVIIQSLETLTTEFLSNLRR